MQIESTLAATKETLSSVPVTVGGVVRDMTIDQRNGQRLAVVFEGNPLIALYSIKNVSLFELGRNSMLLLM